MPSPSLCQQICQSPNPTDRPGGLRFILRLLDGRLRSGREFLREKYFVFLFESEVDNQEDDAYTDCGVGNIEGRPMIGVHMDIEEVDHFPIP